MKNDFFIEHVKVGRFTYGELKVVDFAAPEEGAMLYIGSFCSIASDVEFVLNGEHNYKCFCSFPFSVKVIGNKRYDATSKGDIVVDDDVWIGERATILSGVHIGQGAVIAAGAVVSQDVPPYSIVGGVPAKVIKYRFSPAVIDVLLTIDYSKLTKDMIAAHIDDLYKPLDGLSVEEVEEAIAWMPKKKIDYCTNHNE